MLLGKGTVLMPANSSKQTGQYSALTAVGVVLIDTATKQAALYPRKFWQTTPTLLRSASTITGGSGQFYAGQGSF